MQDECVADTSYLRYTVEPWVRDQLSQRYNLGFESRRLILSPGGTREFDAVSEDLSVVASIKAHSGLTSGGRNPSAKISSALLEVYFLSLIEPQRRLLILTNPDFYEIFTKRTIGQVPDSISVELITLPSTMQVVVDQVTSKASEEMDGRTRANKR